MSTTIKEQKEDLPLDVSDLEQLVEFLYRYSRVAVNREISHSINNFITTLPIQLSMLVRSLRAADFEKAMDRTTKISKMIKIMEEYSTSLSMAVKIKPILEKANVNTIIIDTVKFIQQLPSFAKSEISLQLSKITKSFPVDINAIRIMLLSLLRISSTQYLSPYVSISTSTDSETGIIYIHAHAKDRQKTKTGKIEEESSHNMGQKLGEISLQTMQNIIHSLNNNVRMDLEKSGQLGFSCTIIPGS